MNAGFTPPQDGFSDDRLLAFALGLGDDAELVAALRSSPPLEQRLMQIRSDITMVSDRLQTAVAVADPDYADPAAARWRRLHASYLPPTVSAARLGRWRIGRLVPIVAAIAIFAVAVGVAVRQLPIGRSAKTQFTAESSGNVGGAAPADAPSDKGLSGESYDGTMIALPEAEHFKRVLVARAGEVVDDLQSFAVVRVLKGRVAQNISLLLRNGAAALPAGSLDVLYLRPLSGYSWAAQPDEPATGASAVPSPAGTRIAALPTPASGYLLGDQDAYVQMMPEGVDVSALAIP